MLLMLLLWLARVCGSESWCFCLSLVCVFVLLVLLECPSKSIGVADGAARACQSVRVPECADLNIGATGAFRC